MDTRIAGPEAAVEIVRESSDLGDVQVVHHVDDHFYELLVDGRFAGLMVYEPAGSRYVLTHTFVEEAFRGHGLSWRMMQGVLEDIRSHQLTVTNICPVLDRFLDKNPQYLPLIDRARPGTWSKTASSDAATTA